MLVLNDLFSAHQAVTWILKHLVDVSDVEMALKILQVSS
jgi:hypothetical protein